MERLGFEPVETNPNMGDMPNRQFKYNELVYLWIKLETSAKDKTPVVICNLTYSKDGWFSSLPAVYNYTNFRKTSLTSSRIDGACKEEIDVTDEKDFYRILFDKFDKIPEIIEEKMKGLQTRIDGILDQAEEKSNLIKRLFNYNNYDILKEVIKIDNEKLYKITRDERFLSDDVKNIFIF